jgi:DNA-directed RNA polymerase subunit RPC12/RpoP
MARYICLGCGYESDDEKIVGDPCPYCGELMKEESSGKLIQEMEEIK